MQRVTLLILLTCAVVATAARAEIVELPSGAFEVVHETVVPGSPEQAYDELTGDVSGWWDHSQSEQPVRLVIEGRPGGHFYEHFDEAGDNGAIHATVIYADRGRKLVLAGPLGFSGSPLELVTTWQFEPVDGPNSGASTRVTVTCRAAGLLEEGWAEAIDRVWYHFLIERFQPWMEALDGLD